MKRGKRHVPHTLDREFEDQVPDVRCVCGSVAPIVDGRVVEHTAPNGSPCEGAVCGAVRESKDERIEDECPRCGLYFCEHRS